MRMHEPFLCFYDREMPIFTTFPSPLFFEWSGKISWGQRFRGSARFANIAGRNKRMLREQHEWIFLWPSFAERLSQKGAYTMKRGRGKEEAAFWRWKGQVWAVCMLVSEIHHSVSIFHRGRRVLLHQLGSLVGIPTLFPPSLVILSSFGQHRNWDWVWRKEGRKEGAQDWGCQFISSSEKSLEIFPGQLREKGSSYFQDLLSPPSLALRDNENNSG